MKEFIKGASVGLVMAILAIIALFSYRSCKSTSVPVNPEPITVKIDTVWYHTDSTVYNQPQITRTISYPVDRIVKEYLPDTNYDATVKRYMKLVEEYMAINVVYDSLMLDSFGYVKILDSVTKNQITHRSFKYDIKRPVVYVDRKVPVHTPQEIKRQLYIGGGFQFTPATFKDNASNGKVLFLQI